MHIDANDENVNGAGMSRLIRMMNDIQSACSNAGVRHELDIPRIVVVGGQSAGKSSVLESIVGRHFLPRGSNMVTRCPLILQLYQCDPGETEYGVFKHQAPKRHEKFEDIRQEIVARTDELCPSGEVRDEEIILELHLSHSLNLTLVDLPGRVVNAVGNQAEDIVERIDDLILKYIEPKGTIILAVSGGDNDIATSPALQMAKKVDPKGERTVGVVTKVDLKPKGTDCVSIVTGELYPLTHGFFAVKCRGHEATLEEKSVLMARKEEEDFFHRASAYHRVSDRCGIKKLSDFLSTLLHKHIKECLPALRCRVEKELESIYQRKKEMNIDGRDSFSPDYLVHLGEDMCNSLEKDIYGGDRHAGSTETKEDQKSTGAALHDLFHLSFSRWVDEVPVAQPSDAELKRSVNNLGGLKRGSTQSNAVTIPYIEKNVRKLLQPTLKLSTEVERLLRDALDRLVSTLEHMPLLRDTVDDIVGSLLGDLKRDVNKGLDELIATEEQYVDLNSPDMVELTFFNNGSRAPDQESNAFEEALQSYKSRLDAIDEADRTAEVKSAINSIWKAHQDICVECMGGVRKYLFGEYDQGVTVTNDPQLLQLLKYAPNVVRELYSDEEEKADESVDEICLWATEQVEDDDDGTSYTPSEKWSFILFRMTISCYVQRTKVRITTMAPKTVVHRFIDPLLRKLRRELVKLSVMSEEQVEKLLQPSPEYQTQKTHLLENEAALEKAVRLMH